MSCKLPWMVCRRLWTRNRNRRQLRSYRFDRTIRRKRRFALWTSEQTIDNYVIHIICVICSLHITMIKQHSISARTLFSIFFLILNNEITRGLNRNFQRNSWSPYWPPLPPTNRSRNHFPLPADQQITCSYQQINNPLPPDLECWRGFLDFAICRGFDLFGSQSVTIKQKLAQKLVSVVNPKIRILLEGVLPGQCLSRGGDKTV